MTNCRMKYRSSRIKERYALSSKLFASAISSGVLAFAFLSAIALKASPYAN